MVYAGKYTAVKPFSLSEKEVARYKEISSEVSAKKKDKKLDANASVARIEAAVSQIGPPEEDGTDTNTNDPEFVGFVLTGTSGGGEMSGGSIEVDMDDVYVEEPRVVAEDEEVEEEDERSLWGDGDNDPAQAEED
mmetsp:Transcript_28166/g.63782  ORF Transcript_28166/g.63782 Transcript_28166/m.63782 type:complete len:135 (-) Transcript_28166:77-481(-)|eukprot:CAMPEP_0197880208 /NCGR_PEP_ID=MMETSP1439-20131203/8094_1 /TAXON_ID=66791 /ORGANISM="Gonyaulax spinifera, Strain CCMP409" /LENGTH=134 /DNA_ID=CAMNT_0043499759 /DNA_START=92 /DNA_END=496 /DNA_ORIENTATION=+